MSTLTEKKAVKVHVIRTKTAKYRLIFDKGFCCIYDENGQEIYPNEYWIQKTIHILRVDNVEIRYYTTLNVVFCYKGA